MFESDGNVNYIALTARKMQYLSVYEEPHGLPIYGENENGCIL